MSFARLSHCQIHELFLCLGPDYFHLRGTCLLAREKSNGVDLALEILKWHCANSNLLGNYLGCLFALGRLHLRCSQCRIRVRTRQMYCWRSIRHLGGELPSTSYHCWHCVLAQVRGFLIGNEGGLLSLGGAGKKEQATLFAVLMSRTRRSRDDFAAECVASIIQRPAVVG